jgi:hypothetical protein
MGFAVKNYNREREDMFLLFFFFGLDMFLPFNIKNKFRM